MQVTVHDQISRMREFVMEGYAIITGRLNKIARQRGLAVIEGPESDTAFADVRRAVASCLPAIRTVTKMPASDDLIIPWTLGNINGPENVPWHISLTCDLDVYFEYALMALASKVMSPTQWEVDIIGPITEYHRQSVNWINDLLVPDVLAKFDPVSRESDILLTMLKIGATNAARRRGQEMIVNAAFSGVANDSRRVFIKLEGLGLVKKGDNGKGYYLTSLGAATASRIK